MLQVNATICITCVGSNLIIHGTNVSGILLSWTKISQNPLWYIINRLSTAGVNYFLLRIITTQYLLLWPTMLSITHTYTRI